MLCCMMQIAAINDRDHIGFNKREGPMDIGPETITNQIAIYLLSVCDKYRKFMFCNHIFHQTLANEL